MNLRSFVYISLVQVLIHPHQVVTGNFTEEICASTTH